MSCERCLIRRLSLRRNSRQMSSRTIFPVQECRVRSHPVVPHDNCPRCPLDASLEVLALRNMVVQEVEEEVTLLFLVADDAAAELWVYEERFLSSCRMCPHEGMDGRYRLATYKTASISAVVGLLDGWDSINMSASDHDRYFRSPEWTTLSPCRRFWNSGESLLYAAAWLANNVSPPAAGPSSSSKNVVPGGCFSYVTSECHVMEFVLSTKKSRALVSSDPRWTRWTSGYPSGAPEVGWM